MAAKPRTARLGPLGATCRDRTVSTGGIVTPDQVVEILGRHMLADRFDIVADLETSRGSWLVDARTGERYLDLYSFFASAPLGLNPPELAGDPDFVHRLGHLALHKPANPDIATVAALLGRWGALRRCSLRSPPHEKTGSQLNRSGNSSRSNPAFRMTAASVPSDSSP